MVLPANFAQMSISEQLFVAVNLERVDRGLPAFGGLTTALDRNAQEGADDANDPPDPGQAYDLDDAQRAAFPAIYLSLLQRFDGLFPPPEGQPVNKTPYIAAWHQAPGRDDFAQREFGLHLQVLSVRRAPGKLKYLAGSESGMSAWANDVAPEDAARRLRDLA